MNKICYRFIVSFSILFVQLSIYAQEIKLNDKRLLFLGNSITWAGIYVNNIEAYLVTQHPDIHVEIINAGLPSETVSGLSEPNHAEGRFPRPDLHERLKRVLENTKPDIVFACYGMNDGIYLPYTEERFGKFRDGINWLHEEVLKAGARIIHLTPPHFDERRGKSNGYSLVLDRYADWLMTRKDSLNWDVIDIYYPMKKYLDAHREVDSAFGLDAFALAQDGIHPDSTGHWIIAREVLGYLSFDVSKLRSISEALQKVPNGYEINKQIIRRQNMMRDAWLASTGHSRPGLPKGLPLPEAQKEASVISGIIEKLISRKSR